MLAHVLWGVLLGVFAWETVIYVVGLARCVMIMMMMMMTFSERFILVRAGVSVKI